MGPMNSTMGRSTEDSGTRRFSDMGEVFRYGRMALNTRGIGKMIKLTAEEG